MTGELDKLLLNTGDTSLRRRAKWLLTNLSPQSGEKILDVGCGDGYYLYLLSNLGINFNLVGLDYDSKALISAKLNLRGKKISLIRGDVLNLPFKDNTFDKIITSEVLEHLPNDEKGLSEIYRVLKKGGKIVISVPHKNYPFFWDPINWILEKSINYHITAGFFAGIWNQHVRLYSEDQLRDLLEKRKFRNIKTEILTHICLPFNHHLLNIFARILAGGQFLRKTSLNKFSENKKSSLSTLFSLLFYFDKLNDVFKSNRVGVSLVLSAVK